MSDDIWLYFMELMNGTKVVPASNGSGISGFEVLGSQTTALWKSNVSKGGNDTQIKAMLDAYNIYLPGKTLLKIMREDSTV